MTEREETIEYVAQVLEDVARAGGTHVDDDHASGPGELSPEACRLAARLVRGLAQRAGDEAIEARVSAAVAERVQGTAGARPLRRER